MEISAPRNPRAATLPGFYTARVWAASRSLAATWEIACLLSIPPGTKMFQFPGYRPGWLLISPASTWLLPGGLPHSDIHGSAPAYGYPWRFAAGRVLRRLPAPRHPPYALSTLTFFSVCSFQRTETLGFMKNCKAVVYNKKIRGSLLLPQN